MNPLADVVRTERLARRWSVRRCVIESGNTISNTWWGNFENGIQPLTQSISDAVAAAFAWEADWPTQRALSPSPDDRLAELEEQVAELMVSVLDLQNRRAKDARRGHPRAGRAKRAGPGAAASP